MKICSCFRVNLLQKGRVMKGLTEFQSGPGEAEADLRPELINDPSTAANQSSPCPR